MTHDEIPLRKDRKEKSETSSEWQLYDQLIFIEDIHYSENDSKKESKDKKHRHDWPKKLNKEEFEVGKKEAGQSSISNEELNELREKIIDRNLTSHLQIRQLLEDEFGEEYGESLISEIIDELTSNNE